VNKQLWLITGYLVVLAAGVLAAFSLHHYCCKKAKATISPSYENTERPSPIPLLNLINPTPSPFPLREIGYPPPHHYFKQGTPGRWNTATALAIDPYGGAAEFTLHLEHFDSADWCYPLPGAHVISPYGERSGRPHTGTDIKTCPDDSVRAAFAGIVVMAEPFADYGNCVQLRHCFGLVTLYSHNSKNLVREGDYVEAGQVIALCGRTGRATTEHVHFEVRVDGRHYNSELLFDHDNNQLRQHPLVFRRDGAATILQ
jgi:murein DD-endopeptidase MepM/ murein hydrolase activator NlpD